MEEYAGGYIKAGSANTRWLLAVYAVLFIWGLYYARTYWGGLGPGPVTVEAPPSPVGSTS